MRVTVYTDGGAEPNPGPGGWAAVVIDDASGEVRELSGGEAQTTNNRMELTAAVRALEDLPAGAEVRLVTDSLYLKKGVTEWLPGWQARGFKRKSGELQNEDLWRTLSALLPGRRLTWAWVKGHAGHSHNERADRLATAARRKLTGERPKEQRPAADAEIFLKVSGGSGGGAWAALVRRGAPEEELVLTGEAVVSANALDVLAATAALASLPAGLRVAVYSGSDYLRLGASQWLDAWRARGWRTQAGVPVQNRDAWEALARELTRHQVTWPSTKDHPPVAEWKHLAAALRG